MFLINFYHTSNSPLHDVTISVFIGSAC